jgi:wyosine [tRNA(Phe)-imidazoG37] synthetase (radical SAM superfamily)
MIPPVTDWKTCPYCHGMGAIYKLDWDYWIEQDCKYCKDARAAADPDEVKEYNARRKIEYEPEFLAKKKRMLRYMDEPYKSKSARHWGLTVDGEPIKKGAAG